MEVTLIERKYMGEDTKVVIILTKAQYDILIDELNSLNAYHWEDNLIHAEDCGSKILPLIQQLIVEQ